MTNAPIRDLHISNGLTYVSLAAAIAAIAMARNEGGLPVAGALLALAAIADTFDGRFARMFRRTPRQSRVGGELDSLVDAIVFGLAPVVIMDALPGGPSGPARAFWWIAAGVYVLAAVTRLGFYNVEGTDARFVGVPMPAIALIWSTALLGPVASAAVPWLFVGCAAAMVAPIVIPRPRGWKLAAFALWGVSLVVLHL